MAQFDLYFAVAQGAALSQVSQTGKSVDTSYQQVVGGNENGTFTTTFAGSGLNENTMLAIANSGTMILGADVTARQVGGIVGPFTLTVIINTITVQMLISGVLYTVQQFNPNATYVYHIDTGPAPPTTIGENSYLITNIPSLTVGNNCTPQITVQWTAFLSHGREEFGPNSVTFNLYGRSVFGAPTWTTFASNSANVSMTDGLSVGDISASRQISLSRPVTFGNLNFIEQLTGSGTGYNSLLFCDTSTQNPVWSIFGTPFGNITGTSIGILEDINRQRMLILGSGGQLKRMLAQTQGGFILGQGIIGQDYLGQATILLPAQHNTIFGNDSPDVIKHYSHFIIAADNLQANTQFKVFLDGDTTHPITLKLIALPNGFYRAWINKYARRLEFDTSFDQTDAVQNLRSAVLYWRPVSNLVYPSQLATQLGTNLQLIEGGGNAASQFGQTTGGGGA